MCRVQHLPLGPGKLMNSTVPSLFPHAQILIFHMHRFSPSPSLPKLLQPEEIMKLSLETFSDDSIIFPPYMRTSKEEWAMGMELCMKVNSLQTRPQVAELQFLQ